MHGRENLPVTPYFDFNLHLLVRTDRGQSTQALYQAPERKRFCRAFWSLVGRFFVLGTYIHVNQNRFLVQALEDAKNGIARSPGDASPGDVQPPHVTENVKTKATTCYLVF